MTHNRPPVWVLVGLAVLMLFVAGSAIHNAAWSQGYTWGLLAGNADGAALTPYLAYRTGFGMHPFGGGFGCLFGFGFLVFLALMAAKFFGCRHWQHQGHGPHWLWGQQPGQPQPEPGAGPTPAAAPPSQAADIRPQPTAWIDV